MIGRLLLGASAIVFFILSINHPWRRRAIFLGSYGMIIILSIMFSVISDKYSFIMVGFHQRHFLVPNMIFGWMLVLGIKFSKNGRWPVMINRLVSLSCVLVAMVAVSWGIINFRAEWTRTTYWPDWKQEVSIWKANPDYELHIQPEGWRIKLKER